LLFQLCHAGKHMLSVMSFGIFIIIVN